MTFNAPLESASPALIAVFIWSPFAAAALWRAVYILRNDPDHNNREAALVTTLLCSAWGGVSYFFVFVGVVIATEYLKALLSLSLLAVVPTVFLVLGGVFTLVAGWLSRSSRKNKEA